MYYLCIVPNRAAPGIPDRSDYGDVSSIPTDRLLLYIDQLHKARKAGPHHDIRFGDKELFSWATRKGVPAPGGKVTLFQQPLHSPEYAGFQGEIPEGYGAGTVSASEKGKVLVTEATPDKIKFVLAHRKYPEYFTMIRQEGKGKPWLMVNHTPTDPAKMLGDKKLFEKVHIKSVPAEKAEEFLNGVVEGKVDGASGLFKLKKDSVDVLSYRVGTNGRPIIHTERFFGGKSPKINTPKEWVNRVLRGEVYSVDGAGKPQPAQKTTPLLNMSVANSIQAQRDTGQKLRAALFGVAGEDLGSPARERELADALTFLPEEYFGRPPVARTPEEAKKLWSEIASGKHPEIDEGVVVYPANGKIQPRKIKLRPEYDVEISGVFPGQGKYRGSAGGIEYVAGDATGRVGTGFDDAFRRWMWQNRDSLMGRTAKITSPKQLPSGRYYQPSFLGLHEDYPTKRASSPDQLVKGHPPTTIPDSFLPKKVLEEATEHEMEHTSDKATAKLIAKDHLAERKDYYKMLEKAEDKRASFAKRCFLKYAADLNTSVPGETAPQLAQRLLSGNVNKGKLLDTAASFDWNIPGVPSFLARTVARKAKADPEPYMRSLKKVDPKKITEVIEKNPRAFDQVSASVPGRVSFLS